MWLLGIGANRVINNHARHVVDPHSQARRGEGGGGRREGGERGGGGWWRRRGSSARVKTPGSPGARKSLSSISVAEIDKALHHGGQEGVGTIYTAEIITIRRLWEAHEKNVTDSREQPRGGCANEEKGKRGATSRRDR